MHTNSDSQICVYMDTYDYVYDMCVCVLYLCMDVCLYPLMLLFIIISVVFCLALF